MLTTPDTVRQYLSLKPDQDTDLLTALCAGVDAFILSSLTLESLDVIARTEVYNGNGSRFLTLDHRPIKSVESVTISSVTIPAAGSGPYGYVFSNNALYLRGCCFTIGVQNVAIAYTAGYTALPEDLKRAACDIVAEKYQRRLRQGVASKTIGAETIAYSANDITPFAKQVLSLYKRPILSRA